MTMKLTERLNVDGVTINIFNNPNNVAENGSEDEPKLQANVVFGSQEVTIGDFLLQDASVVKLIFRKLENGNRPMVATGFEYQGEWYGDRPDDGTFKDVFTNKVFKVTGDTIEPVVQIPTLIAQLSEDGTGILIKGDLSHNPVKFLRVGTSSPDLEVTGTVIEALGHTFTQFNLPIKTSLTTESVVQVQYSDSLAHEYKIEEVKGNAGFVYGNPTNIHINPLVREDDEEPFENEE